MLRVNFACRNDSMRRILCLGAHSDDIEIGCGGTILRFLKEDHHTEVCWIVFSGKGQRAKEAKESANLFLENAGRKKIVIKNFRDGFFPYIGYEIKEYFEGLKKSYSPDIIFTHYRDDLHQDHRLISELTWNTFRDHMVLEYEIIKYDGDLGTPSLYVHLDKDTVGKKVAYIRKCFGTQGEKKWFADDTFFSMLRLRGIESNSPDRYAEGFYCRKMVY
jgi:LmbE family N-acetylglucosaminyl deacetylase